MKQDSSVIRFEEGTFERIQAVLYGGEIRAAFIRMAVDKELAVREELLDRKKKRQ